MAIKTGRKQERVQNGKWINENNNRMTVRVRYWRQKSRNRNYMKKKTESLNIKN